MKSHRDISSVYVAASSTDIDRAQHWSSLLSMAGLTVTSTWPSVITEVGNANPRDATPEMRREWSTKDLEEIALADVLWFLVPAEANGRGAYFETGYAHALKKVVFCSGDTKQSIFCALGDEYVEDLAAFATICRLSKLGAWR